jgi:hypothetical protein
MVAALVIFCAGLVTGGILVSRSQPRQRPAPRAPAPAGMGLTQRLEYLRRLEHQLKLNPGQKERAEAILRESQERMAALWERIAPDAQQEFHGTREKIRALLDAEQLKRYDELMKSKNIRKGEEGRDPKHERRRWNGGPESDSRAPRPDTGSPGKARPAPLPAAPLENPDAGNKPPGN